MPILLDLYWRDVFEIIFFSWMCYRISLWLKQDKINNLLWYFYGYCGFALSVYLIHLPAITWCLLVSCPVVFVLFTLMHQHTLQRNIVALKKIAIPEQKKVNWIEPLLRVCLIAINQNKRITCIIEHDDDITPYITKGISIDAPLNESLLTMLIESKHYHQDKSLILCHSGKITSINSTWRIMQSENQCVWESWEEPALIYTSKTDALVVHANSTLGTFALVMNGELFDTYTAQQIKQLLHKHMHSEELLSKGVTNDAIEKNTDL